MESIILCITLYTWGRLLVVVAYLRYKIIGSRMSSEIKRYVMRVVLFIILFNPFVVLAGKWVPIKFGDLYTLTKNNAALVSVTTYTLGNGEIVSISDLQSRKNNSLFKCFGSYSKNLQPKLGRCYVLEE